MKHPTLNMQDNIPFAIIHIDMSLAYDYISIITVNKCFITDSEIVIGQYVNVSQKL